MNVDTLRWCNLVVTAAIALEVDVSVIRDVMHEIADFICMRLNHHLVFSFWIDDANDGSIGIYDVLIDVRTDVIEPQLLSTAFETSRTRVVQVCFQEFFRSLGDDFFGCHAAKLLFALSDRGEHCTMISTKCSPTNARI